MKDDRCVHFLQWALPELHLRWPGFRRVRRQVCKRVDRRMQALGLEHVDDYEDYLETHDEEWAHLDSLCRITISRFNRDRGVFARLAESVLPELIRGATSRGDDTLRAWCVGCASGEEPYTLAILWQTDIGQRFPGIELEVTATDSDRAILGRAATACYSPGSLKELPEGARERVFTREGGYYRLHAECKSLVRFLEQDIREGIPEGRFDLVLCRNLVFTYFDEELQADVLHRIVGCMTDGGALVIGIHEDLPASTEPLQSWFDKQRISRVRARTRSRPW